MDYSWVTNEMFEQKLEEILKTYNGAQLLTIPGVYELLSEHFNNEVLSALQSEREVAG